MIKHSSYPRIGNFKSQLCCLLVFFSLVGSTVSAQTGGFAPAEATVLATLPGKTINNTVFTSASRFNWNGELGNWTYQVVSPDVGKITQTYDEDGNNSNIYREETLLNFSSETTGNAVYTEYYEGVPDPSVSQDFSFPWLLDSASAWYDSASNIQPAGWRYFDWFKGFKPEGENWIYHGRHGWLFVLADDTSGMFLWDGALGRWMFTNEIAYPWMYAYGADEGWVFFFEGGRPGSRYFKRGDTGGVVSERQLRADP